MQVTHQSEVKSYAVVGGGADRAFSMSNSAAFFEILSNSLYSNKPLAVIREVVCNAVDAHIASGVPDREVDITIDTSGITVQDFGPGIPDDRIAEIYACYGGSTKKLDDKMTGGFGLGSKSPFALVDNFTVTSQHAGVTSIYLVTKGDGEVDSPPGIRLMTSFPNDGQTGLTVQIPPFTGYDARSFMEIAKGVVRIGGMRARLNGENLPFNDYTVLREHGIAFSSDGFSYEHRGADRGNWKVLVGNVAYPLNLNQLELNDQVVSTLNKWVISYKCAALILAEPSSVSITPSRETLSYDDRTKAYLSRRLNILIGSFDNQYGKATKDAVNSLFAGVKRGDFEALEKKVDKRNDSKGFIVTETMTPYEVMKLRMLLDLTGRNFSHLDISLQREVRKRWGRTKEFQFLAGEFEPRWSRVRGARVVLDLERATRGTPLHGQLCFHEGKVTGKLIPSAELHTEIRRYANDKFPVRRVYVAERRQDLNAAVAGLSHALRRQFAYIGKLTEGQLETLRQQFDKHKIELVVCERVKKEVKEPKKRPNPPQFISPNSLVWNSTGKQLTFAHSAGVSKAKVVWRTPLRDMASITLCDPVDGDDDQKYLLSGYDNVNNINGAKNMAKVIPELVIPLNDKALKTALEGGAIDVNEWFRTFYDKEFAALAKKPAGFRIAVAMMVSRFVHGHTTPGYLSQGYLGSFAQRNDLILNLVFIARNFKVSLEQVEAGLKWIATFSEHVNLAGERPYAVRHRDEPKPFGSASLITSTALMAALRAKDDVAKQIASSSLNEFIKDKPHLQLANQITTPSDDAELVIALSQTLARHGHRKSKETAE